MHLLVAVVTEHDGITDRAAQFGESCPRQNVVVLHLIDGEVLTTFGANALLSLIEFTLALSAIIRLFMGSWVVARSVAVLHSPIAEGDVEVLEDAKRPLPVLMLRAVACKWWVDDGHVCACLVVNNLLGYDWRRVIHRVGIWVKYSVKWVHSSLIISIVLVMAAVLVVAVFKT